VRSIVRRVQVVSAAATRVIDGGSLGEVEPPAGDELGQLAAELMRAAGMLLAINEEMTRSRDLAIAATEAKDVFLSRMNESLAKRGLENSLAGRDGERVAARFEADLAGVGQSLSECGGNRPR
jgi:hypothetical protein